MATANQSWLSVPDVAREFGVSQDTIRGWIASGALAAMNTGNGGRARWRVRREDLDRFVSDRMVGGEKKSTPSRRRRLPRSIPRYV